MRLFCLLCMVVLLGGCVKPSDSLMVQPLDEAEFRVMTKALRPQMEKRGVLDKDGAWYSPMFSSDKPQDAGEVLLTRLSPAFRFPSMKAAQLPTTFKGMLTAGAQVAKTETSFSVKQGLDKIYVSLLAVTDWNHDGKEDWIVLCRIEPQTTPGGKRDYYLVIADLTKPILVPDVIAIRDCVNNRCQIISTAADPGLVQDSSATEMLQGQETITQPPKSVPAAPAPARRGSGPTGKIQTPALPPAGSAPQDLGSGLSRETLSQ